MENALNKLIICAFRGGILSSLSAEGRITLLNYEREGSSLVGNIYLARVQNILKNLDAAFLDIGEKQPAYLSFGREKTLHHADGTVQNSLKAGDEILVKIKKDAHKTKGPLAGSEFPELKEEELLQKAVFSKAPTLLRRTLPFFAQLAETTPLPDEIITDIPVVYAALTGEEPRLPKLYQEKLPARFRRESPPVLSLSSSVPVRFYADEALPLTALWSLETALKEATERRVWLKSGGTLIIDPVEAMTVIDVNTGKNIQGNDRQETIRKTDLEAADEVMRQLRLRNLSGIILVDFIDLRRREDRAALMDRLHALALLDPVKTQIVDITRLHLVEITRQKSGQTLAEQLRAADR